MAAGETKGIHTSVPCPWCAKRLNFSDSLPPEMGGTLEEGEVAVEKDALVICDFCKKFCKVTLLRVAAVVGLVRDGGSS